MEWVEHVSNVACWQAIVPGQAAIKHRRLILQTFSVKHVFVKTASLSIGRFAGRSVSIRKFSRLHWTCLIFRLDQSKVDRLTSTHVLLTHEKVMWRSFSWASDSILKWGLRQINKKCPADSCALESTDRNGVLLGSAVTKFTMRTRLPCRIYFPLDRNQTLLSTRPNKQRYRVFPHLWSNYFCHLQHRSITDGDVVRNNPEWGRSCVY